jgi:5-methylcytosine-specific restriction endonuclease McrA
MTKRNGKPCLKCGNLEWDRMGRCLPCARVRTAKWKKENKDMVNANCKKWCKDNRKKRLAIQKKWRDSNKEKQLELCRAWEKANPHKVRAKNERRRAKINNANGNISSEQMAKLFAKYPVCLKCGSAEDLTHDHVVPLSLGGDHTIENSQVLCRSCNASKATKVIDYR